jgi:hypothetical protein
LVINGPLRPEIRGKYLLQIGGETAAPSAAPPQQKGAVVSELIHCQTVVERMVTRGRTLAEIEEYIDRCALDDMQKAGLWMLAWASQDRATQLRLANETLALVASMRAAPA